VAAYTFRLPDLGEGVAEGEVARWLVREGDVVAEDQPLLEVQTDKATVEIPSPAAGPVARILVEPGVLVPVGTALVVIGDIDAEAAPTAAAAPARMQATPAVRRLADELGVAIEALAGSGPGGRITEDDVRAGASGDTASGAGERLSPTRRAIADHLTRAHREVPAVTVVEECDFSALEEVRAGRSLLPLVLAAVVSGLRAVPELNATFVGGELRRFERVDIGVAVQTERGLLVPVLRGADRLDRDACEAELTRLAEGARAGTLAPAELRGSTFTITSAGKLAGLFATPLVNHPEVGIFGLHRIGERPVVRDGAIVVRRIGLLSCTFDHRVVDGARAAAFLLHVVGQLELVG